MLAMHVHENSALLIIQCKDPLKWYSSFVGKYVPLIAAEGTEYRSQEPAGYTNFVSYLDADVVDLTDNIQYY